MRGTGLGILILLAAHASRADEAFPLREAWAVRYNGPGSRADVAAAIAVGGDGGVYVTGASIGEGPVSSCATVHYDPDGNETWTARHDQLAGRGVVVDEEDNAYVVAEEWPPETSSQSLILKYDRNGLLVWTVTLPPSRFLPTFLALNGSEGVYVLGQVLSRLDPSGTVRWTKPTGGLAPGAITLDPAENAYVTGSVVDVDGNTAYSTAKYAPDGSRIWEAGYAAGPIGENYAVGIVVEDSGGVYVTGTSNRGTSNSDIATLKYAPDGTQLWVDRFDGAQFHLPDRAAGLAFDLEGNVIVVGQSPREHGDDNIVVLRYDSQGVAVSSDRFDDPGKRIDYPRAAIVDSSGSIFVTGFSTEAGFPPKVTYLTMKFDKFGQPRWAARYSGARARAAATSAAMNHAGDVHVTGGALSEVSGDDYVTIKYDPEGQEIWARSLDGPDDGYDFATDLVVDGVGNAYVTGFTGRLPGVAQGFVTILYDDTGHLLWEARYDPPARTVQGSLAIGLDQARNVYVTGVAVDDDRKGDIVTIKYDSSGRLLWDSLHVGEPNFHEQPLDIACAPAGECYVCGLSESGGVSSLKVIKYDSTGHEVWSDTMSEPRSSYAAAMALDPEGNVCVAGALDDDLFASKYSPDGTKLWVARLAGNVDGSDAARAIAVDATGNVYVTGSISSDEFGDFITVKYGPDGMEMWTALYDRSLHQGTSHASDVAEGLALDTQGNVYVTGVSTWSGGRGECTTIKYDPEGRQLWTNRHEGGFGKPMIQVLGAEVIIACGSSLVEGKSSFALIRYLPSGDQGDVIILEGMPAGLAQASGHPYLSSSTLHGPQGGSDIVTRKFALSDPSFLRGDCDGDGSVVSGVADALFLVRYAFQGGSEPPCLSACDADGDGRLLEVTDAVYLLRFLFMGGPSPPPPFPDCGTSIVGQMGCQRPRDCP
jgi:uncharacterized delta-60 repeat protein